MNNLTYPPDFVARVKATYRAESIHKLCDENSPVLGLVLCDMQGGMIHPQTILDCDNIEGLRAIARNELERRAVWLEWQETEIAKKQGF